MTLKFPLINLISRGHLPLANRTACLNFAKNIEDGPATRICYEMMKLDDLFDAARFLEEAVEVQRDMLEGSRAYFAESDSFTDARDKILMRESSGREYDDDVTPQKMMSAIRNGGIGAGALYIMSSGSRKRELLDALKKLDRKAYEIIQDNYLGRKMLPQDPSYFKRLFNNAIGAKPAVSKGAHSASDWLKPAERVKLNNFMKSAKRNVGWGVLIAASITTAIVGITMLYKRFFSAEAKACNAYGGKERTVCMTKARIKACDAAINASKKALLDCSSAKNEEDCIFKMKVEIRSWTKKKALEEEKLRKLTNVNTATFVNKPVKRNDPFA